MTKYSQDPLNNDKAAKARGSNLRVHYKNTVEAANAIKGLSVQRAQTFLHNVIKKKEIVPFRKFTGCVGRKAQTKVRTNTIYVIHRTINNAMQSSAAQSRAG